MVKMFEVVACWDCLKIMENKETQNNEDCIYFCSEAMPYIEVDLALHLGKIQPKISICEECAMENNLEIKGDIL